MPLCIFDIFPYFIFFKFVSRKFKGIFLINHTLYLNQPKELWGAGLKPPKMYLNFLYYRHFKMSFQIWGAKN
jgi:hypothetical protein